MTAGSHRTIVMDPPWRTASTGPNSVPCGGKVSSNPDYDTISDSEIAAFPIDKFAAPECGLFIWSIHKKMPVAMGLLDAWGFKHYFTFTRAKRGGLTIQDIHRSTEFAVFGYRGPYPCHMRPPRSPRCSAAAPAGTPKSRPPFTRCCAPRRARRASTYLRAGGTTLQGVGPPGRAHPSPLKFYTDHMGLALLNKKIKMAFEITV